MEGVWVVTLLSWQGSARNEIIGVYTSNHRAEVELYNYLRARGCSREIYFIDGNRYSEGYTLYFNEANTFRIEEFALNTEY